MGVHTPTRALSGGNMQKLILGRALVGDPGSDKPPTLIVANQPTWGLDIGAVAYVHQQLLDACAAGAAVLLISEDLDEIFALADRIAVMHDGRLGAARPAADWTLADIGLAMAGVAACTLNGAPRPRAGCCWPPPLLAIALHAAGQLAARGLGRRAGGQGLCAAARRRLRPRFAWSETLTRATPLILTGLAAAVAFRARLFNIGAEGQLYAGALAAVAVGGLHGGRASRCRRGCCSRR